MKRFLAALTIGLLPIMIAAPARADTCQQLTVIGPVCLPALPSLPAPPATTQIPAPVPSPVIPVQPKPVPAPALISPKPAPAPATESPKSAPVVESPKTPEVRPAPAQTTAPEQTENKATTPCPPGASKNIVKTRVVTLAQAITLSIGTLILGTLLTLLGLYVMYRIGKREGENGVNEFMSDLLGLATRSNRKS